MNNFFKVFLASLLALIVFSFISFFVMIIMMAAFSSMATNSDKKISANSVLMLDLNNPIAEQSKEDFNFGTNFSTTKTSGLYDVVRMIAHAKTDDRIKGIYIKAENNANGFATSRELREAISDFKSSKKFVIAYAPTITQKAYYIASAADKIYTHPEGGIDWRGLSTQVMFFKGTLDKLEVEPQIFFAGKYKSATEPFRVTKMTEPNRVQTAAWLNDLYDVMLQDIAKTTQIDTATLRSLADNFSIQTAEDALKHKMVHGLKYNDEIQTELRRLLGKKETDDLSLVSVEKYSKDKSYKKAPANADKKIALVYAEGQIMQTGDTKSMITSEEYIKQLRKVRLDDKIDAVVFRVNSPGGSALASDEIWREIELIKKKKPVVVSMGDVAASGGYYISCGANRIFADPNTITGSIGVFAMTGNAEDFFKNKLGITFDTVKTSRYADFGNFTRAMNDTEKRYFQSFVDTIYHTFKSRVAQGRSKSIDMVDSLAQGRVWSGLDAKSIGLVDEVGSLKDAINYTAGLLKTSKYELKEYPKEKSFLSQFASMFEDNDDLQTKWISKTFGPENAAIFKNIYSFRQMMHSPQALMPYTFDIR